MASPGPHGGGRERAWPQVEALMRTAGMEVEACLARAGGRVAELSRAAQDAQRHLRRHDAPMRGRAARAAELLASIDRAIPPIRRRVRPALALARVRSFGLRIAIAYYLLRWWVMAAVLVAALVAGTIWILRMI